MTVTCQSCGSPARSNSKFCGTCGEPIGEASFGQRPPGNKRLLRLIIAGSVLTFLIVGTLVFISSRQDKMADEKQLIKPNWAKHAAFVNENSIPLTDLDSGLALKSQEEAGAPQQNLDETSESRRAVLTELIREEVVLQEGRRLNVSVDEAKIDERVSDLRSSFSSEEEIQRRISELGFSTSQVRDYFERQLLLQVIEEDVGNREAVRPKVDQLRAEFDKSEFPNQSHIAHILICSDYSPTERKCNISDADRQRARDVAARAKSGEDFTKLAREFSVDPSASQNGGDLGFHSPGRFVPRFDTAAFALAAGQISEPVETEQGLHVIKMIDKGRTFEQSREELTEALWNKRRQHSFETWRDEKLRKSRILVNPDIGSWDRNSLKVVGTAS